MERGARGLIRRPRKALALGLSEQTVFRALLAVGAFSGLASLWLYNARGYSTGMLVLWVLSLVALSAFLWSQNRALPRIALADLLTTLGLVLVFAPLYLLALYRWPVQVSSDEVAIIDTAENYSDLGGRDPFGVSEYLGRPALGFVGWGNLAELFGGFGLQDMRLLHALFGLLTIAACYALFRQLFPRGWAMFAAGVVGTSHALLMISRLAMRENTSVLVEVVALALLLWGLRRNHALATFWGGFVAGLGFYVYQPARATLVLWVVFLIALGLIFRSRFAARRLVVFGSIAVAGFTLMAAPILIAESKVPTILGIDSQRETLMIYPEARALQQIWVRAPTIADGYKTNVKRGLTAFNNEVTDHGFIYVNTGHGFADPLTGILLWLGFGVVAIRLVRHRADEGALLMLLSFVALWLSYAFVVNKAPNYTRLLVTLPFVAFLVTEAVRWLAARWRTVRLAPAVLAGVIGLALVAWNLAIAWDYVQEGRKLGDPIGSTGRYVASLPDEPRHKLFVATGAGTPFHVWGDNYATATRLQLFAEDDAQVTAIDPTLVRTFNVPPPFALFMKREVWRSAAGDLAAAYPQGRLRNAMPDGSRVVLEVPAAGG